jgi:hypothetical protein
MKARKIHKAAAFAGVILTVGAVTAVAASTPPGGVTKSAMNVSIAPQA